MELGDSPDEAAFREGVRAWLQENLPAGEPREWSRKIYDAGYAGLTWPEEYGGKRCSVQPSGDRAGGVRPRRGAVAHGRDRPGHGRPDDHGARHRGAEAALPLEDPLGGGDLVPGLLRAGSGLRPVGRSNLDRRAERLVRRQRAEGVVVVRAHRRPLHPRRPKRPGLAAPRWPDVHHRRHEGAGRRGAPAAPDHRRGRVQRDLPHGRRGAEGEPSRRDRRRLAGCDDDAPPRARNARLRARRRAGASGAEARRRSRRRRAPTTRSSGTASPRSGSSSRR